PGECALPLVAEDGQRPGIEREQAALRGVETEPPSGEDPEAVPVGEHEHVPVGFDDLLEDAIHADADPLGCLPARAPVCPQVPLRPRLANLPRGEALVLAVVELAEVIDDLRLGEAGEACGVASPAKRTAQPPDE